MAFVTIKDKDNATLGHLQTDANERLGVHNLLHVQDQKASGTHGGTFTSGAWRTRDLNTVIVNNIVGASLLSNCVALPSGKYFLKAKLPFSYVNAVIGKVIDTVSVSDLLFSANGWSQQSGTSHVFFSLIEGDFELTNAGQIELQHRCTTSWSNTGFGVAASLRVETYSDLKIWKVE